MRILPSAIFSLLATTAMADTPRVVADIAPVHSLVAQVMDGVGAPELLIDSSASPHGYALRPSQARALQQADIVFWVGAPLTPWLEHVIEDIAGEAEAVTLLDAQGTMLLPNRDVAVFEHHDHGDDDHDDHDDHGDHDEHDHHDDHDDHGDHDDRGDHDEHGDHDDHGDHDEHGDHDDHGDHDEHDHHDDHDDHGDHDEHGDHDDHAHDDHEDEHEHEEQAHEEHDDHDLHSEDPHAWLDPVNAKQWLQAIAGHLAEADPENAVTYQANATRAIEALDLQISEIQSTLAPHKDKTFIVFHDAYQYFEARFDLSATGAIRLGDATAPSAARLVELREELKEEGVVCAFTEPQYDGGILAAVTGEGVKQGVLDPQGAKFTPGADLYGQVLDDMATAVADCLR